MSFIFYCRKIIKKENTQNILCWPNQTSVLVNTIGSLNIFCSISTVFDAEVTLEEVFTKGHNSKGSYQKRGNPVENQCHRHSPQDYQAEVDRSYFP